MSDDWMTDHKGEFLYRWGRVWECGDDECGCTEAQIVAYYQNKVVHNGRVPVVEWSGEFRSDHEAGADEELAAHRRHLREADPQYEAATQWQRGIDYGDLEDD